MRSSNASSIMMKLSETTIKFRAKNSDIIRQTPYAMTTYCYCVLHRRYRISYNCTRSFSALFSQVLESSCWERYIIGKDAPLKLVDLPTDKIINPITTPQAPRITRAVRNLIYVLHPSLLSVYNAVIMVHKVFTSVALYATPWNKT